ncbi:MAG: hypothetical protein K5837_05550 [Candidatus Saccharibacteria bacterium]|nr:hypothetical protein [Candidatus Saccharibacteria bacterium]
MGKGEYKLCYGTIGTALMEIAEGLERHDYALVPEVTYRTWTSFGTFKSEMSAVIRKRDRFTAHFEDEDGQKWDVVTYKCTHEHFPLQGVRWRFIERIKRGGKVFAGSKITIAEYEKKVRKAQKKAEEEAEYFRSFSARWFSD